MCGTSVKAQPKLDVENACAQLLVYERDAVKACYEEDIYLRHKKTFELEMVKIKEEGLLPILVEYVHRVGVRWDEAQKWLKTFDLIPEDLSPMEFCKLVSQTPRGRILYFEEHIFPTAMLRLTVRKELDQLREYYGLSIVRIWNSGPYHVLWSLSVEIMSKYTRHNTELRKDKIRHKGLQTLLVLNFFDCLRENDFQEARRNGRVLDPQDLSIMQWRELRGSLMIDVEHPDSLNFIKGEKAIHLPMTWEYEPYTRINRLDRWVGVGLVLIHLWNKSMEQSLHKPRKICVHLIDTPGVHVSGNGLSSQETKRLRSSGRLEFRYSETPKWLSKDLTASWAGIGMVKISKDELIQSIIIEVLWAGRDGQWYDYATEKESIRLTRDRMAQLSRKRKIEIPRKGRHPIGTYPRRVYQKGVGIIEFSWPTNEDVITIKLVEAQCPLKTTRDRGRGLYSGEPRDLDSLQRQRRDLEAEESIRPNFGWRLCPTTEGIQPKWRIIFSEGSSEVYWLPNLNIPSSEISFRFDKIVSRRTINTLQRNLWWAMGKTRWLVSLVETRDHRLKVRIWGDGPYGFLVMPEEAGMGEGELLRDGDMLDGVEDTPHKADAPCENSLREENAPHREDAYCEEPHTPQQVYGIMAGIPSWERQLYGFMDEFWISLPMVNEEHWLFKLVRNDYYSLRRDRKLILPADPELAAKLVPTKFRWTCMGDVLIQSNGPVSLLFESGYFRMEEHYDKAPFRDVEFRFEGMPWYA
jgi:hypothetical protein